MKWIAALAFILFIIFAIAGFTVLTKNYYKGSEDFNTVDYIYGTGILIYSILSALLCGLYLRGNNQFKIIFLLLFVIFLICGVSFFYYFIILREFYEFLPFVISIILMAFGFAFFFIYKYLVYRPDHPNTV